MRTLFFPVDQMRPDATTDEQALDDVLACTFPASDPVSITFHRPLIDASTPTEISLR